MATGVEVATSSHIEEMIKELVQPESLKVPAAGMITDDTTTIVGEPLSQSSLPIDLSSVNSHLGKRVQILYALPFSS